MRGTEEPDTGMQLDERAATEVMGWVRGGPDLEFWALRDPPPGLTSVFRMPVTRWRPTQDPFCLDLLVEEIRSQGLSLSVAETEYVERHEYTCVVADPSGERPPVSATAPTPGLAVVCAVLARAGREPAAGA